MTSQESPGMASISISKVDAYAYRAPIHEPVRTSFGQMQDRPAVLVRIEDSDGAAGWGEAWCNFPQPGAEHRARLINTTLAPLLLGRRFDGPICVFQHLSQITEILAMQSGEPGPFAQAIAGMDIALWDLCARRAGQPLWRYLGGTSDTIGVYASGINPTDPVKMASHKFDEGYRSFKLKIGFGQQQDLSNLQSLRAHFGSDVRLMADANQRWTMDAAMRICDSLAGLDLDWLEEPLRADVPWPLWRKLADATGIALAAGENVAGQANFAAALQSGALSVVQPDIAKWGGISGNWPVIEMIKASGHRYCPHYLGAGIGLLASAHVLAASGQPGILEIDSNSNPLRTSLCGPLNTITVGRASLGPSPGLGIQPDLAQLDCLATRTC